MSSPRGGNTSSGSSFTKSELRSLADYMDLYDSLPPLLRAELQQTALNFAPDTIIQALSIYGELKLLSMIREQQNLGLARDARKLWGPNYPVQPYKPIKRTRKRGR